MTSASAPGKIILLGEHAVVYGQPAIALPVTQVHVDVEVGDSESPGIWVEAPEVGLAADAASMPATHPVAAAVRAVLQKIEGVAGKPSHGYRLNIRVTSDIPSAAGLGSGTAVSVALARALSAHLGQPMSNDEVSEIAIEVDKLHHGTPSGIDNTVVTFGKPVFFQQGKPIEVIGMGARLTLVIGDTGVRAPTKEAVADVRRLWESDKPRWEAVFARVGEIVREAQRALDIGDGATLGGLMNKNHTLLQEMTVSSVQLDALVRAARQVGAWGAKMSGGGRGGSMVALVEGGNAGKTEAALWEAGARRVITTQVG